MIKTMSVIRRRKRLEYAPRRPRPAGPITSFSGACEWLLMQYEEIDRKFPLIDADDEHVDTLAMSSARRRRTA
jgi:hypothetical protein